jgi:acetolactate decarboxylase
MKMKNNLFQVSSLQALLQGYYKEVIAVKELKEHGDTGLGTFVQSDGEMILLDGHVYQALYDGRVIEAREDQGIPFGVVTFFHPDETVSFSAENMEDARRKLDEAIQAHHNHMAVIRMEGMFDFVQYRSGRPVPSGKDIPLADWLNENQKEWTEKNIAGTAAGIYMPAFMNHLNCPGWHLHFLSEDHHKGGHVLDLKVKAAKLSLSYCKGFEMIQPEDEKYERMDLSLDQTEAIERAEK